VPSTVWRVIARAARIAARMSLLLAATSAAVLAATPAMAGQRLDDGEMPAKGIGPLETVLIYSGIPAALFLIIALLVLAPSMARGPRYRPGLGWWAAPVWFNGPDDADAAVRTGSATVEAGGSSARW
jgi:hypothetical protein